MAPKKVDRKKKKFEIAYAAIDLFAEGGLAGFSMSLLAKRAGIGKGTIYEYFSSREELIFAAIDLCLENIESKFSFTVKETDEPGSALREASSRFIQAFTNDLKTRHFLIQMSTMLSKTIYYEQIMNKFAHFRESLRAQIEKIFKTGIKKGKFKQLSQHEIFIFSVNIVSFLEGTYSNVLLSNDNPKLDQLLEYYFVPLESWLSNTETRKLSL